MFLKRSLPSHMFSDGHFLRWILQINTKGWGNVPSRAPGEEDFENLHKYLAPKICFHLSGCAKASVSLRTKKNTVSCFYMAPWKKKYVIAFYSSRTRITWVLWHAILTEMSSVVTFMTRLWLHLGHAWSHLPPCGSVSLHSTNTDCSFSSRLRLLHKQTGGFSFLLCSIGGRIGAGKREQKECGRQHQLTSVVYMCYETLIHPETGSLTFSVALEGSEVVGGGGFRGAHVPPTQPPSHSPPSGFHQQLRGWTLGVSSNNATFFSPCLFSPRCHCSLTSLERRSKCLNRHKVVSNIPEKAKLKRWQGKVRSKWEHGGFFLFFFLQHVLAAGLISGSRVIMFCPGSSESLHKWTTQTSSFRFR